MPSCVHAPYLVGAGGSFPLAVYGIFGLMYNKRHDRIGKEAHGRPKTLRVQDNERLKNLMFYIDCNPARAGIIKSPTDIRWKDFSSCRFHSPSPGCPAACRGEEWRGDPT